MQCLLRLSRLCADSLNQGGPVIHLLSDCCIVNRAGRCHFESAAMHCCLKPARG